MRSVITAFLFLLGLAAASQIGSSVGRKKEGWEYQALDSLKLTLARDPASTIALTDRMISAFRDIRDRCALAEVYGLRSGSFNSLGKYDSALVNAQQVFSTYEASCDSSVLMRGQRGAVAEHPAGGSGRGTEGQGLGRCSLIDQVTVLFTDFKGFTAMSEVVTPRDWCGT
jgi:hypothetical protein